MEALIVYNPNSGALNNGRVSPEEIAEALRQAGYEPVHRATETEADLDEVLKDAAGLVVSAGGDGTFRAVATRLVGKNVPVTPLPMGTANNLCRALGVTGKPLEIAAALQEPVRRPFDLGMACFPWGREYFLEALGFGFYADTLALYRPEEGKSLTRSISTLVETLRRFVPHPSQISLDGRDLSGAYLNVACMNTNAFGPRLKVAPEARTDDGLLDIVRVAPDRRTNVIDYLTRLAGGNLESLDGVEVQRGRRLDFLWEGWYPIHLDGEVRPAGFELDPEAAVMVPRPLKASEALITVEALPGALELWLPPSSQEAGARVFDRP